jgi:phosphoribosylformylglycinamidine (FGAM) synthase-like amidotransferase family enzyme
MTATLFQTGNDLSDDFMKFCYRRMKANSFDVYEMIGNSNVSIKHHARRGPSEFVGYTENGSAQYIAGVAYDSFDVWVQVQHADSTIGRPGCSKCVAENVRSFEDAIAIAQENLK